MTDGEGATPLEDAPSAPTATLVAARSGDGDGNGHDTAVAEAAVDDATGPGRPVDGAMAYNPALDGIRGLAVAAVLLFHGGFSWARGGYLGVSTFFTLSGFLITSLLITEHRRSGRIGLTAFWARRLRRLMPPAAVTLAVVMLSALFTDELWERALGGDVIAAALNVANWRFLFEDQSYAALFTEARSPVLHFWSLAIEEQFYWVFPLLAAGVLAKAKGSLRVFGGVLLGLLGVSAVLTLIFSDTHNTVYYSTPIRMGEILVGALLAVGLALTRGRLTTAEGSGRTVLIATALGATALAASVWAWWNIEQTTNALYQGGLLVYAVLSGCLVFAACVPGPVRRLLAFEPFRLLGLISYGVYLIHWPVFLFLDEERVDGLLDFLDEEWVDGLLDPFNLQSRGVRLFAIRLAVTLVLAIASYRWLEQPIRRGRRPRVVKAPALAAGSLAAVVLVAIAVPAFSEPPADPFDQANLEKYFDAADGPEPGELLPDATIGIPYGDSTMVRVAFGLSSWGLDSGRLALVGGGGGLGCALGHAGEVRYGTTEGPVGTVEACAVMQQEAMNSIDRAIAKYGHVDFGFIMAGPWDVADRKLPGDDQWRHIGDEVYDEYLRGELESATDIMLQRGLTVVLVTQPHRRPTGSEPMPEEAPERMDAYNTMLRELADAKEGVVVLDLAGWVAGLSVAEDEHFRLDGTHFDDGPNVELAERFFGEELIRVSASEKSPFAGEANAPPTTGP